MALKENKKSFMSVIALVVLVVAALVHSSPKLGASAEPRSVDQRLRYIEALLKGHPLSDIDISSIFEVKSNKQDKETGITIITGHDKIVDRKPDKYVLLLEIKDHIVIRVEPYVFFRENHLRSDRDTLSSRHYDDSRFLLEIVKSHVERTKVSGEELLAGLLEGGFLKHRECDDSYGKHIVLVKPPFLPTSLAARLGANKSPNAPPLITLHWGAVDFDLSSRNPSCPFDWSLYVAQARQQIEKMH